MRIKKLAVLAAFAALTLSSCATGPTSDTTSAATTPSGTSESSDASEETSEATTSTDYTGQELIVTSFGGDWEVAFIEAVVDPFEADTGASVTLVTAYSADAMAQLQAAASNPPFDVIHFSGGQESLAAESGLISPIDSADLSTFDDLVPVAVEGLERGEGPVIQVAPVGVVYNTEMVTDVPTSFEDIFRPEYAQHIALTDISNTYGLFTLLAVNDLRGGDLSDVQPGVDALSALATSGDAIVVATSADLQHHI